MANDNKCLGSKMDHETSNNDGHLERIIRFAKGKAFLIGTTTLAITSGGYLLYNAPRIDEITLAIGVPVFIGTTIAAAMGYVEEHYKQVES